MGEQMIPRYFPGEDEAIARVLEAGAAHGYGNMIQRLSEAWSKMLQEKWGLPKDAADRSAFNPEALLKFSEQGTAARIAELEAEVKRLKATPAEKSDPATCKQPLQVDPLDEKVTRRDMLRLAEHYDMCGMPRPAMCIRDIFLLAQRSLE